MTETIKKAIASASKTLALLSKVRCVESYSFSSEERFKILYSWPSKFENVAEVVSFLKEKGIATERNYNVKSYPVPYNSYRNHKTVDLPGVTEIRLSRSLLHIHQLAVEKNTKMKIRAVWDTAKYPARPHPKSMSDIEELAEFSKFRDSMFVFERINNDFPIKLPAFSYRSLLMAIENLKNHTIEPEDRSASVGKLADGEGRSNRYIVHCGNKNHLSSVLGQTSQSIEKLVGLGDWVFALKEDGEKHYNK